MKRRSFLQAALGGVIAPVVGVANAEPAFAERTFTEQYGAMVCGEMCQDETMPAAIRDALDKRAADLRMAPGQASGW
jgi:hypothetical protein